MGRYPGERGSTGYEDPQHAVTVGYDFYLSETEITQAQWTAVTGSNPATGAGAGDDFPVYSVSWNDVREVDGFIERLNSLGQGMFALPSEAEWEYACRAGTDTRFCFGDNLTCDDACSACTGASQYMWWCGNNGSLGTAHYGTKPVGGKLPNAFGLYDMHGNVDEWCQDTMHYDYVGAPVDGSAWETSTFHVRVIRGGAWVTVAQTCSSSSRAGFQQDFCDEFFGLRVLRTQ